MRHRKSGRSLSRNWEHRKAMLRNMAKSLVVHEKIRTTVPKARELSKMADRLVTLALRGDLSARREAYKVLNNHKLVQRLFNELAPKFEGRQGGYTRVVKYAKPRVGDGAALAMIEFSYSAGFESEAVKAEDKSKAAKIPAEPSAEAVKHEVEKQEAAEDKAVQEKSDAEAEETKAEEAKSEEAKSEEADDQRMSAPDSGTDVPEEKAEETEDNSGDTEEKPKEDSQKT